MALTQAYIKRDVKQRYAKVPKTNSNKVFKNKLIKHNFSTCHLIYWKPIL